MYDLAPKCARYGRPPRRGRRADDRQPLHAVAVSVVQSRLQRRLADPERRRRRQGVGAGVPRDGGLGIAAGAAVFVAALAVPLDDPALAVALMLGFRGGRLIPDV